MRREKDPSLRTLRRQIQDSATPTKISKVNSALKNNSIADVIHDFLFSVGWKKPYYPIKPYHHVGGATDIADGDDMNLTQLLTSVEPTVQQPTIHRPSFLSLLGFKHPPRGSVYVLGVERYYKRAKNIVSYIQGNAVYIGNGMFLATANTFGRYKDPAQWEHSRIFAIQRALTVDVDRLAQGRLTGSYELAIVSFSAELGQYSKDDVDFRKFGVFPWKDDICLLRVKSKLFHPSNRNSAIPGKISSDGQAATAARVNLTVYNAGPASGHDTVRRYDPGNGSERLRKRDINRLMKLLHPLRRSTSTGIAYEGDCMTAHKPEIHKGDNRDEEEEGRQRFLIYEMSTLPGASGGAVFLEGTRKLVGLHSGSSATLQRVATVDRNLAINISHGDLRPWFLEWVLPQLESDKGLYRAWSIFLGKTK